MLKCNSTLPPRGTYRFDNHNSNHTKVEEWNYKRQKIFFFKSTW